MTANANDVANVLAVANVVVNELAAAADRESRYQFPRSVYPRTNRDMILNQLISHRLDSASLAPVKYTAVDAAAGVAGVVGVVVVVDVVVEPGYGFDTVANRSL